MRWCCSKKPARPVSHKTPDSQRSLILFLFSHSRQDLLRSSVSIHVSHTPTWTHFILYAEGVSASVCMPSQIGDVSHGADLKQDLLKDVTKWNGSYSTLQSYWFLCLVYLCVLLLLLLIFSKQKYVLLFCMNWKTHRLSNIYVFLL